MLVESRRIARGVAATAAVVLLIVAFLAGRATVSVPMPPVVAGPLQAVDGVMLGYEHTELGATAAGAHYLLELERAMDTLSVQRTVQVAGLLATSTEARAITTHAASVIALERAHGAPLRRIALSTNLTAYSTAAADVTVLESWIYATSAQEALWAIERVSLVWRATGWRVSAITGAASSEDESLAELRAQLSYPGPGDASVR
jgi:hypothetical protein